MPEAYLAYNPLAGRFPSRILAERAANLLRSLNWRIRLEQSRSAEHISELAKQAADEGADAFFVVGGDGSLNHALPGLLGTDTALAVLPAGTANVWAQELGLPGLTWTRWMALEESAKRLAQGTFHRVDVGLCNGRPFLLWAGIGLDAFLVHRVEPRGRWEKHFAIIQYAAGIIRNAAEWHGMPLHVQTNDWSVSGHYLLGVISNIHLYAGGYAEISKDARLDDGRMDFWLFEGETLLDTVHAAWDLFSGSHESSDRVEYIPFERLLMESDAPLYVQLDGEPVSGTEGVEVSILPRALRVLTPQELPHNLFSIPDGLVKPKS